MTGWPCSLESVLLDRRSFPSHREARRTQRELLPQPASPPQMIVGTRRLYVVAGANRACLAEGDFYLLARQLTPQARERDQRFVRRPISTSAPVVALAGEIRRFRRQQKAHPFCKQGFVQRLRRKEICRDGQPGPIAA